MKLHKSTKTIRVKGLDGKMENRTIVDFGATKVSTTKHNLKGATDAYKKAYNA